MSVTHILSNPQGNRWILTGKNGEHLDTVIASGPNQAMLAVQHLVPRSGEWTQVDGASRYVYDSTPAVVPMSDCGLTGTTGRWSRLRKE